MTMITVMFQILLFGFCFVIAGSILFAIPIVIYTTPYSLWVGSQNCIGKYKHLKDEKLSASVKNATKLYIAFFLRKEPML